MKPDSGDRPVAPLPDLTCGVYRHYKGGRYEVYGVARHSETLEPMVVYRPLYGEGALWVRPFAMFTGQVAVNGELRPRFERETEPPHLQGEAGRGPCAHLDCRYHTPV